MVNVQSNANRRSDEVEHGGFVGTCRVQGLGFTGG